MEGDFGFLKIRNRPRKSEWGVDDFFGDTKFDLRVSGFWGFGLWRFWVVVIGVGDFAAKMGGTKTRYGQVPAM